MPSLTADSPLTDLAGVGPKIAEGLERLGLRTVQDLAEYLPSRLEDRSRERTINALKSGEDAVINVTIRSVHQRKSKRGLTMIQANVEDETGKISVLWFNQRYLLGQLKTGAQFFIYGTKRIAPSLGNPFFAKAIISRPSILPIYRTTKGLPQAILRRLISQALASLNPLPALLPQTVQTKNITIRACHQAPTDEALEQARTLLAEEELLLLGLTMASQPVASGPTPTFPADPAWLQQLVGKLSYKLTDSQRRSAWEIIGDLSGQAPMRRVLYGEVGSGKTIVALLVAATVIKGGGRVAVLVPTTTLADQQSRVTKEILSPYGVAVATVTGARKESIEGASLIIGTQAILQKQIELKPDLIIIDEQQRFGVAERQRLLRDRPDAHLLMMTATPIPRSLAHILFGQMKLTYLRGKPAHQQPVTTKVFRERERSLVERDIAERLKRGEPGYVICPLIESNNNDAIEDFLADERKTILKESARLKKEFPTARVAVLHGRLKNESKEKILADFKAGRIDILVSTTVVEVGIDNPQASWILVEEADRFGLAQLHQLRGRVGRGHAASICYLAERDSINDLGRRRLQAIERLEDGLELAEADLSLRGPGEIIGLEQSGLPRLRYADWRDVSKIKRLFALAEKIVQDGIDKYPELRKAREKFEQTITIG